MGVLRPCGLAAPSPAASWRLYGGVEAVRAGCGFMGVLRPCGLAARSELGALRSKLEALPPTASWRLYGAVRAGRPQRVGGFMGVLRPGRAGCPQRVGGFMEVLRLCGLAAHSELEALLTC